MVACWPEKVGDGRESDLLCGHVDFVATACELAGVTSPPANDGLSLLPTLLGQKQFATHDSLYWEIYEGPHPFQQAVRMHRWKGHRTALQGPLELYDFRSDPKEQSNVATNHPELVARIEGIMAKEHVRNLNWAPTEKPSDKKSRKPNESWQICGARDNS